MLNILPWPTVVAAILGIAVGAGDDPQDMDSPRFAVSQHNDLAGLLDLCADQLRMGVEYDSKALKALPVTVRLPAALSAKELLALTHQLLASRGYTTVQAAGWDALSVVKINEAAERARIEPGEEVTSPAGFVSVMRRVHHRPAKEALDAIRPLLSKPGGAAAAVGDEGVILLSDLRPRIDQALWVLNSLDTPAADVVLERLGIEQTSAAQLAATVTAAVDTRNAVGNRPLKGKLRPMAEENSLVVVAPEGELPSWRELVRVFDVRQAVDTRSYGPRYFSVEEVARLMEQSGRDPGPRGSGERWRLVRDELTGTLIVTATPDEHQRINDLMTRLDSVPAESRRPVRSFLLRNRRVKELIDVLSKLVEAGVLEGEQQESVAPTGERAPQRQRSEREVFASPDGGSRPPAPAGDPSASGLDPARAPLRATLPELTPRPARADRRTPRSLTLTADEATNTLIAAGDSRLLAQLEQLVRTLDVRQSQVMIEVLVVTLSEGQTIDLGVELQKLEISGSTVVALSSLFGLGAGPLPPPNDGGRPTPAPSPTGRGFTGIVLSPGDFSILVRALETVNDGRSLSMPKVLVSNNQQATLDSVLQQPFTSTNASDTVATTSFGGTQDAGTTVSIKPHLAAGDHLMLEYSVSLSSFVGESSDRSLPPPRQQNNLQSVVSVPDGYTIVVGGLEISTRAKAVSQVPLLGDLPLLGEVFKNRSTSESRSRFYVFIRANVLRHERFEDLKYFSDRDAAAAEIDDGWPRVEARAIE